MPETAENTSLVVAIRASMMGRAARREGLPLTACPHDPLSEDPRRQLLAKYWVTGWTGAHG